MKKHFKLLFVLQLQILISAKATANSISNQIYGEDPPDKNQWIGFSKTHLLTPEVNEKLILQINDERETSAINLNFDENDLLRNFVVLTNGISSYAKE